MRRYCVPHFRVGKPALAIPASRADAPVMRLPDRLDQNFRKLCGISPTLVIRALYDMDGGPGATWLAVGENMVVFYHRPSGGEFSRTRFRINEIIECVPSTDGVHACLRFRFPNANFTVKGSLFDQPRLDSVARACHAIARENPLEPPARLTPTTAFCAAIHAVLDADERVDPLETDWLCRTLPDPVAIGQGSAWYRAHGLERLLATLPSILDPEQRECLLVNQLSAIMADGLLEPAETALIDHFRRALGIPHDRHDTFFRVILSRNQIALLQGAEDESLLRDFVVCLVALSHSDAAKSAAESEQLARILNEPSLLADAEAQLREAGSDAAIKAVSRFDPDQARTLLANLLALAMTDGEITGPEQDFMEKVRLAVGIDPAEYHLFFSVLLAKHNLGILTR